MFDDFRDIIKKWKESSHFEKEYDMSRFVLMALLREGPLTLKELEEKSFLFISQFGLYHALEESWDHKEQFDITAQVDSLLNKGFIVLTGDTYELTDTGEPVAVESAQLIEKGAQFVKKNILSPSATARNTVLADFFLALMKLTAGVLSGSVGLLADGADAAVDTGSASAVWVGMKLKKEMIGTVVIIAMMVITGVTIGYESVTKIIDVATGTVEPISRPYLVMGCEGVALVAAALLCFYQGFIGKKYRSLALVSQSIDSKNHIYVAAAVILGAVFSMVGVYFVDAIIGVYVSFKILKDGTELSREVISSVKGEETDFSKYETFLEKRWKRGSIESFRFWTLYNLEGGNLDRDGLITGLERTFKQTYIPVLSEFEVSAADGFDFDERFHELIQPLLDQAMVTRKDNTYVITRAGRQYVDTTLKNMRYHQIT